MSYVPFNKILPFYSEELLADPQAGRPSIVGCLRLLIQHIRR
jgi:hypothetical protein